MTDQNDSTKAGPMERRLQSREVAIACGVHIKTLGLWRRVPGRGPEPFYMVSPRCYVYPESAVERWLAAREGKLAPPAFPQDQDGGQDDADFGVAPLVGGDGEPLRLIEHGACGEELDDEDGDRLDDAEPLDPADDGDFGSI